MNVLCLFINQLQLFASLPKKRWVCPDSGGGRGQGREDWVTAMLNPLFSHYPTNYLNFYTRYRHNQTKQISCAEIASQHSWSTPLGEIHVTPCPALNGMGQGVMWYLCFLVPWVWLSRETGFSLPTYTWCMCLAEQGKHNRGNKPAPQ